MPMAEDTLMNDVKPFHVSEMQAFIASQQAVPLEIGDLVLAVMQKRYGFEFNKKFNWRSANIDNLVITNFNLSISNEI